MVKYFAIAAQFLMLFLTLAFLKPYTSSSGTASGVVRERSSRDKWCLTDSEHNSAAIYKLLLLCFTSMFGLENNPKNVVIGGARAGVHFVFAYSQRRIFVEEGFGSSRQELRCDKATQWSFGVSITKYHLLVFFLSQIHLRAVA